MNWNILQLTGKRGKNVWSIADKRVSQMPSWNASPGCPQNFFFLGISLQLSHFKFWKLWIEFWNYKFFPSQFYVANYLVHRMATNLDCGILGTEPLLQFFVHGCWRFRTILYNFQKLILDCFSCITQESWYEMRLFIGYNEHFGGSISHENTYWIVFLGRSSRTA